MEGIQYFLKELSIISKEYQMLEEREEKFNIFSALHKIHDERRLHSRFISVLLQPNGSHGFYDLFLDMFIKTVNRSGNIMLTDDSKEDTDDISDEYDNNKDALINFTCTDNSLVYPTERDKSENNNIDILIIDRIKKQCIVVENKIFAGDSSGAGGKQLQRYINHVQKVENIPLDNISVIYLTLDGHEPSKNSVGSFYGEKEIVLCSYQFTILTWLEKCLTVTSRNPFLRESIAQYIKLIKKMTTDNTSNEERIAYRNLIGKSSDNMLAAKKLVQNFKHIKWHAVQDFWLKLQSKIVENNYSITNRVVNEDGTSPVITEITHFESYRKGQRNKQKCILNFEIEDGLEIIIRYNPWNGFYFGVATANKNQEKLVKLKLLVKNNPKYKETKSMVLHKKFNHDIPFNNFNNDLSFDLICPESNASLVEETWNEVATLIDEYLQS